MNCSRKSWTEYIISHAECTSTSNPTRQGNPFRGAVGDLDRSNCSAQSSTGRNASIPPNLPFYLMDYLVINVQLVIAICGLNPVHNFQYNIKTLIVKEMIIMSIYGKRMCSSLTGDTPAGDLN